jgi:filamentous hemagglutinin family protein
MKSSKTFLKASCSKKVIIYFLTYCMVFNTSIVLAAPTGGAFVAGPTGSIDQVGTATNVTVAGMQSVIEWTSLDTAGDVPGPRESLNFFDGGFTNAAVLNRVSGAQTHFDGDLTADTGMRIFVVNPAGIIFGAGSTVNVTQLVASGLSMSNDAFMDATRSVDPTDFVFEDGDGVVENYTTLDGAKIDSVYLIGKKIINDGTILTNPEGLIVMAAGDRVVLGQPNSKVIVEMDSVTLADPENPEGLGDVINNGSITSNAGQIVLAAGDVFSLALDPPEPVRVETGIGRVEQNGTINADGTTGDGGSVTLTAGDEVILATDSVTTANGGTGNDGANGGEVIAYASEMYADTAVVDFQAGADIQVRGGSPSDPATVDTEAATFEGGLAELSGDHLYFNGSVDATSTSFDVPDPENPGSTITFVPDGGTLHIDPVSLTLADGPIPGGGAAMDTFYEEELEAYSQAGVDTILEADYDITVENISDGVIEGGSGDIALRTVYNTGGINFLPATEGGPVTTTIYTVGGGNIFMLAGSGGIVTGNLITAESDSVNPGRIRIFTNNGDPLDPTKAAIETGTLTVDGGNEVEVSVVASGDLAINGNVVTNTNKVPANEDQTGTAYICLVSENGSVNVLGAVEVEAHGKNETVATIHICADNTVNVQTGNRRVQAIAKTSSAGTADAEIRIHAGSDEPDAITVTRDGGTPIRLQANTSGSSIGPLDFTDAEVDYEQTNGGSYVLLQIADTWLDPCPDCPTPPDLPPPVEPPNHNPVAVDDYYTIDKGDAILIILDTDGVLVDGDDLSGADYDPDSDVIIAILFGGGTTAQGGSVVLEESGAFEYTAPTVKEFDDGYGTDGGGDYALFIDTFTYYAEDPGALQSNQATVTITSKNYIPVAEPDYYDVVHNVTLEPPAENGIIQGIVKPDYTDHDFDSDPLTPYFDDGLPGDVTSGTTSLGGSVTLYSDGSFSYEPPTDVVDTDSFTYYVHDGYNYSESVEVTIDVTNTQPVAQPDTYDVVHNVNLSPTVDQGVIVGVVPATNGDYDDDGDSLTPYFDDGLPGDVTSGTTDQGGTVTLNSDGSFSYDPPSDWVGTDTFTYYVNDGYDDSLPVQVTIDVTNTQPVAMPDTYHSGHSATLEPPAEDGLIQGIVKPDYTDYDDDGDPLTPYFDDGLPGDVTSGTTDQGGTVTLYSDGSFTYDPPASVVESDTFTYYVYDGYDNSEPVQVTIVLTNTVPVAQPDSYDVVHNLNLSPTVDQGIIVGVVPATNGDYDADGDALTPYFDDGLPGDVTSGTTDQGGTVTLYSDGSFSYDPPSDWVGTDSFTYYVSDGYDNSTPVAVTIDVTNTLPVAQPDAYDVVHNVNLSPTVDQGIIVGVLPANADSDPDGDALTPYFDDGLPGDVTSGTTDQGGTVTLNSDGSFSYDPPADWVGTDTFTYYVYDGYDSSAPVDVTIDVTNTQPVAQPDNYDVVHNVNLSPTVDQGIVVGVLPANADSDPDGDTLTPYFDDGLPGDVTSGTTDQGGTVTLNSDGSFSYDPPADWVGTDSFTYYVYDGYDNSAPVDVTIDVTNTLPIARPDSYEASQGVILSPTVNQGIIVGVLPANADTDADGDALTPYLPGDVTSGTTDQGGTVTLNPDGSFSYDPPAGWIGIDTFTYYVYDGYDNSAPVEVTIQVGQAPAPVVAAMFVPAAPIPEPIGIEVSGCPALIAWAAAEFGVDQETIQIWFANAMASGQNIQPCDACARLQEAATILQDTEGNHIAALAQLINEYASSTLPPTEEQMAAIADAIANNIDAGSQYAMAGEYLDALAEYVGILTSEMDFSAEKSVELAADKYVGPLAEGENAGVAAFIQATLAGMVQ